MTRRLPSSLFGFRPLSASNVATRMAVSRSAVSYAEASERNGTMCYGFARIDNGGHQFCLGPSG